MITKDKNKLAQTFRELPIAKLIRIAHGNYTYDLEIAVEIAGDIIAERQKEVISFFQKMGPFELFSNLILPDFKKYNPATFIGIKQVFLERKREMYKQLKIMDDAFKAFEEIIREMEEALRCNFEYPSEKQRLELGVAGIKKKGDGFIISLENMQNINYRKVPISHQKN